jgi:hypothetical protein
MVYKYQLMFVFVTHVESGGVSQIIFTSPCKARVLLGFTAAMERCCQSLACIGDFHAMSYDIE